MSRIGRVGPWVFYLLMIAGAVVLFLLVREIGEGTSAPAPTADAPRGVRPQSNVLGRVLLALAVVVVLGQLFGRLFARVGQPPVVGEVVAGIVLGPSLLGHVWPDAAEFVLPASAAPFLGILAQFGVVLYMFLVGLELDSDELKNKAHATVAISHASIVAPFLLGSGLALFLYPRLSTDDVPFTSFALFIGVALSITAFPVLARILADRGLTRTPMGVMALSCAAADDVTAWCLLAFVVGVARSEVGGSLLVAALTLAYLTLMFVVARPLLRRWLSRYDREPLPRDATAGVLLALLASSLATEAIGVHAIFGAFLLGAVIPHDGVVARAFVRQLESLVTILLLPAFFAYTGLRTRIGLLEGWQDWLLCGLIVLVATVGKFGGTLAAARLSGLGWRTSAALGVLMNTRGLMGLIVLNVGLDLGVISPRLFAMMVVMALATTVATAPALYVLAPRGVEGDSVGK